MGLPLFVIPVEPEVQAKAAEKVAAGPRSSIRRHRGIRSPHARLSAEHRRRRLREVVATDDMTGSQWDALENQQSGASRDIEQSSTASFHTRALRSFEDRMRLRDTLSFEPQSVPTSDPDGPLPPVPESRDYSRAEEIQREIQHLSQVRLEIRHNLRRMARRIQPAPTPPYTEGEVMFMARAETNLRPPRNFSSFTPDLSLSPLEQRPTSEVETSTGPDSEFSFTARGPPYRSESLRTALSERVQALNRASSHLERSQRLLRNSAFDGLGDRERSISPDGPAAWETLLTSITPDPQPPSVGSSFASDSASAAAAASSNSGPASASTSMTSLDRLAETPVLNDCDISDLGSNAEDEEEEDLYELQDFGHRNRGHHFWRSYADVVISRGDRDRTAQNGFSTDSNDPEHLESMHRIISRLADVDEIPEEWWASAGLSRNLPREPAT